MPAKRYVEKSKTSRLNKEQRAEEARLMYLDTLGENKEKKKLSYRAIAEKYNCSLRTVQYRLNTHMPKILEGPAETYRQTEILKLDELEEKAWEILSASHPYIYKGEVVTKTDPESGKEIELQDARGPLNAIKTLISLSESRRKLMGLDQPTQVEATVRHVDPVDESLKEIFDDAKRRSDQEEQRLRGG